MNPELMTHVERIVRPVRARQSWKLRARLELLSHLEQAYAEELERDPDAAGALARAKARLGEPAELTRRLAETAPVMDRVLFTPLPAPRAFNAWERDAARRMGIVAHPMVSHAVVLFLTTMWCPYAAAIAVALIVDRTQYQRAMVDRPVDTMLFNVACMGLMVALWYTAARVMRRFSAVGRPPRPREWVWPGMLFLGGYLAIALMCVAWMARRPLTASDVGRAVIVTATLLLVLTATGRVLAAHRRRYEPWVSLDVAG